MKTALEQLIDFIDTMQPIDYILDKNQIKMRALYLLETEKQQIIDAFNNGYKNGKIDIEDGTLFNEGSDYYNSTFKDK